MKSKAIKRRAEIFCFTDGFVEDEARKYDKNLEIARKKKSLLELD
jgi:phage/plasmid-associated DNA primase